MALGKNNIPSLSAPPFVFRVAEKVEFSIIRLMGRIDDGSKVYANPGNLFFTERRIGNPVRIGSGPAAVIGDEIRTRHFFVLTDWEGAKSRTIREPEDLPE